MGILRSVEVSKAIGTRLPIRRWITPTRYGRGSALAWSGLVDDLDNSWIFPTMRRRTSNRSRDFVTGARAEVIYSFGGHRIDTMRFEIARDGEALAVEPQVLGLLIVLIATVTTWLRKTSCSRRSGRVASFPTPP